jgi:hypothetical protein
MTTTAIKKKNRFIWPFLPASCSMTALNK